MRSGKRHRIDPLIKRARKGDQDAWKELYTSCEPMVRVVIGKMFRNYPNEVEDVVQQTMLKIVSHIDQFKGQANFKTWVYTIARREALMFLRHKKHRPDLMSLDHALVEQGDDTQYMQAQVAVEDRKLSSIPLKLTIRKAIDQLPPGYRLFVTLHDLYQLEHHEISKLLGCHIGCSKSQVHKGRAALRKIIDPKRAAEFEFENKKLSNGLRTM